MRVLLHLSIASAMWAASTISLRADPSGSFGFDRHHMWSGGHGWFFGPLVMIGWLAIAVLIIVVIVRLASRRPGDRRDRPTGGDDTPLDILKRRFARGEIDEREFEEKRKRLQS